MTRSTDSTEVLTLAAGRMAGPAGSDGAADHQGGSVVQSALAFAVRCHARQRRSDGSLFVEHPLEVARLLRGAGCAEEIVAAGLLHAVVEQGEVSVAELTARFGAQVAQLVRAVSDDECVDSYRQRKRVLRDRLRSTGGDATLLFAATTISDVREISAQLDRDRARFGADGHAGRARGRVLQHHAMRLEHYQESLAMLERIAPRHPLVRQLARELDGRSVRGDEAGGWPDRPADDSILL